MLIMYIFFRLLSDSVIDGGITSEIIQLQDTHELVFNWRNYMVYHNMQEALPIYCNTSPWISLGSMYIAGGVTLDVIYFASI